MSKAKAKGTTAEREVVRYLQNWWPAAERRALSGNKDKGDVAGIANMVVEIKAGRSPQLAAWRRETIAEQANAYASGCLLVVKRPYKPVHEWDAHMPLSDIGFLLGHAFPPKAGETWPWVRMDLALAVLVLKENGY